MSNKQITCALRQAVREGGCHCGRLENCSTANDCSESGRDTGGQWRGLQNNAPQILERNGDAGFNSRIKPPLCGSNCTPTKLKTMGRKALVRRSKVANCVGGEAALKTSCN
jgi:hypothetical protein